MFSLEFYKDKNLKFFLIGLETNKNKRNFTLT